MLKDLLILKFKGYSKVTMEGYAGYFIVKRNGEIKYKVLQYPTSLSSFVKCSVSDAFKIFQKNLNDATLKITRSSPEFNSTNSSFNRYVGRKIVREPSFGMKLISAYQMNDKLVLKDFVKEFFEEWIQDLNLEIGIEELYFSEFSRQFSRFANPEDVTSILQRADLDKLSEAYPIVDPIHGKPVATFDVGDRIYFTVLKFFDEESKKKILEAFPDNFDENGENVKPLVGTLISKELVKEMGDFMLIKMECAGVLFKSVVYGGVNIMWESVRVPSRSNEDEALFSSEEENELREILREKEKISLGDILVALFLVVGVVLAIMIGLYFFFWK